MSKTEEALPRKLADHIEHRLRTWRQQHMNRSGDRLALDDFMGEDSIADLVDFVCDEYALATLAQRQQVPAITDAMVEAAKSAYQAGYNVEPYALRIRLTLEAALTAAPPVQQQSEPRADDEGRCTRCGLPFEDPAELQHECPPGFTEPAAQQQSAQPEQQPVAWRMRGPGQERWQVTNSRPNPVEASEFEWEVQPLYATQPRAVEPLTEEQILDLPCGINTGTQSWLLRFARAIERAHGIGKQEKPERG